jgi:hypothetical protein
MPLCVLPQYGQREPHQGPHLGTGEDYVDAIEFKSDRRQANGMVKKPAISGYSPFFFAAVGCSPFYFAPPRRNSVDIRAQLTVFV